MKNGIYEVNPNTGELELLVSDNQITSLPTASEEELGNIYQYVGTTNSSYTNGYFYKCVSDGQNPATYSWERISVQPEVSGSVFTNTVSCSVGAVSAQLNNPLGSTSIAVEPFSQCVSGAIKDITNIAVTTSTITLNFSALLEATDFFCRVESIS